MRPRGRTTGAVAHHSTPGGPGHRRPGVVVAAALLAAGLGTWLAGCAAQRDGAWPTQAMGVTGWSGYVETFAQARHQEFGAPGNTREDEETFIQESIRLAIDGYAYHPNLFQFSAGGLFGLVQRDFTETYAGDSRDIDHDGPIDGYDFEGTLFGRKNYPLSFFASKQTLLSPRSFRSSVLTTTERYGLDWRVSGKGVSNLFHTDYIETHLDPLDPLDVDGRQINVNFRDDATLDLTDTSTIDFSFEHRRENESPYDLDYVVDRGTLRHRQLLGDHDQHRLDSSLDVTRQTGSYDYSDVHWREWMRLEHSEAWRSEYRVEVSDVSRGNTIGLPTIGERTYDLSGLLEHRLFDSLITQLEIYGRVVTLKPDGEEDEVGTRLSPTYRKKTPIGLLMGGYRGSFSHRTQDAGGSRLVQVIDESHAFNDPLHVVLDNRNVDQTTIFVTAPDNITVYYSGVDYLVLLVGDRTELERLPTGTIPNGGQVLVDYVYDSGGNYVQDTWDHTLYVRHRFDFGLSVYYTYFFQEQGGDSGSGSGPVAVFEDIRSHTVGTEFNGEVLDALAEYEDRDSNIDAYQTLRIGGTAHYAFNYGGRPSLGAQWTRRTQSEPTDRTTELLALKGRYRQRITEGLNLDGGVGYRNGHDSLSGDDEGVDADLFVEWLIHKFELRLRAEYNDYESDYSINNSWLLYLQVRRNF